MTHTPGPWRIGDAGFTVFGPKNADGTLPVTVAPCKNKANARLIAAAPDLLAALKHAIALIADIQRSDGGPVAIPSVIRAAIAKAEGKE